MKQSVSAKICGAALAAFASVFFVCVRPASAAPDWSGNYQIVSAVTGVTLPGYSPVSPDLDAVVLAHLKPWARMKMEATNTEADDTGAVCLPAGIFRHPTTVAGFRWLQKPGEIILISDTIQEVGIRRIYLTDHHPRNLAPTWDGHSIGHWEGDTLVVDTIGFNDKSWLMSSMEPHTEELHLVERIRSVANGQALEVLSTVDDRQALTGPYSFSRFYKKSDKEFTEASVDAGSGVCNAEPGEQQRWNRIRKAAIARQMANRAAASAPTPSAAK